MRNRQLLTWGITGVMLLCSTTPVLGSNTNSSNNSNAQVAAAQRAAFSASRASRTITRSPLIKYANARSLTDRELVELLRAVGFRGEGLKTAWAVAKAESNGRPRAFNGNRRTGDNSYGVFQINMIGDLGPERREKFELESNEELFNPVKNAQIVFYMTQGGTNWKAWKYAQTEAVQRWMKEFPKN